MEPSVKDRDITYQLIIGQLYHDGHWQLALDLKNSIGMNPSPPASDKLFRLVSNAQLVKDDADEEEMDIDMQIPPNQVVASTDNLSIDEESRDYFPFDSLPPELKALVFSYLTIKDRFSLAAVNNSLNTMEREFKYHVEELIIATKPSINAYSLSLLRQYPHAQSIVFLEDKSYPSDCIRRIAHNASIGDIHINLGGSSEFHREVFTLIKEFDIGQLRLDFQDIHIEREIMVESFILDLARSCKGLGTFSKYVTAETLHEIYKLIFDGSAKIRQFDNWIEFETCDNFLRLIGITYEDGTFLSNRNIEVYKEGDDEFVEDWHIFDGFLEMNLNPAIFEEGELESYFGYFYLIRHETQKSLDDAKNKNGMVRIEIGPQ